jgi:hypothetical protein
LSHKGHAGQHGSDLLAAGPWRAPPRVRARGVTATDPCLPATQSSLSRLPSGGHVRVGRLKTASWWRSSRFSITKWRRLRREMRSRLSRTAGRPTITGSLTNHGPMSVPHRLLPPAQLAARGLERDTRADLRHPTLMGEGQGPAPTD